MTVPLTTEDQIQAMQRLWMAMDACNMTGILYDITPWIDVICTDARDMNLDTDKKNQHPVILLLLDKLREAARYPSDSKISDAFAFFGKVDAGKLVPGTDEYHAALNDFYGDGK